MDEDNKLALRNFRIQFRNEQRNKTNKEILNKKRMKYFSYTNPKELNNKVF